MSIILNGSNGIVYDERPVFSVYQTAAQSITAADTKILMPNVDFDPNGWWNASLSRFLPLVAGYYLFVGAAQTSGSATTFYSVLYRNGGARRYGAYFNVPTGVGGHISTVHDVAYMNGSTDYTELFAGSSPTTNTQPGLQRVHLSGFLVRPA